MLWLRFQLLVLDCIGVALAQAGKVGRRLGAAARGQSMVEYGIIIAVVAVVAMVAIQAFGNGIGAVFTRLLQKIQGIG